MHTGIISFADRIVYNIKSNEMKDIILEQINTLYNIKIIQKHYYKLDENNVKYITRNPHLCTLRTNGNPYYMFFTLYNDIPIIYFIDKKVHPGYQKPRILLARGMFSESLFKNTLIDGEMVKTVNKKWLFLMNDIISFEGKFLRNEQLPDRLKLLYNLLETKYVPDKIMDVCTYKIKTYYQTSRQSIEKLIEISKTLNYTCRGIYIWSYDLKYKPKLFNFNEDNIINVVRKVKDETSFKVLSSSESSDYSNNTKSGNNTGNTTTEDNSENTSGNTSGNITGNTSLINSISKMKENTIREQLETNIKYNKIQIEEIERNKLEEFYKESTEYKEYKEYKNCKEGERILWICKTEDPDVYNIYDNENKTNLLGNALVSSLDTSKMMRIAFKNTNVATLLKIKCSYNTTFNKWLPIEIL